MIRLLRLSLYWPQTALCLSSTFRYRKLQRSHTTSFYFTGYSSLSSPAILYLMSVVAAPRRRSGLSVTKSFKSHQSQMSAKQLSLPDLEALGKTLSAAYPCLGRFYLGDMNQAQASSLAIVSIKNKVEALVVIEKADALCGKFCHAFSFSLRRLVACRITNTSLNLV